MKVFLGYGYNGRDKWIPEKIIPFIESLGHTCVTGEKMQGERLSEGVISRISECDALIGFLTRRKQIQGQALYTTSTWVVQEITSAMVKKKQVFEIRENGIETQRGLTGDRQLFTLEDINDIDKVFSEIKSFLDNTSNILKLKKAKRTKRIIKRAVIGVLLIIGLTACYIFRKEIIEFLIDKEKPSIETYFDKDNEITKNPPIKTVDTVISGSLEFYDHPYMKYNLLILPYYLDDDSNIIEPISNITEPNFEAKKRILQKNIGLSIQANEESLKDWIISSSGKTSMPYKPNENLVLRKKDDYYMLQMRLIKSDISSNYSKIKFLSELDWISDNTNKWYALKHLAMDYLFESKQYLELAKLCETIEDHTNFEKIKASQKDYVFSMWIKTLRKMIELEHKTLDAIYKDIGSVGRMVIEHNSQIKTRLRILVNSYNKHYGKSMGLTEKDLLEFLNK